ncbi:12041_t:CDS:2 [Funneliformis mosseae]|uniref:12041_t:CDS:1 n=1 Tax=Funneliformis mosseae TaxID=27381 RepID=A0A9N8ZI10_FUNMO|nr:12041_t:CDS:2 [Funneliformis mosseae]
MTTSSKVSNALSSQPKDRIYLSLHEAFEQVVTLRRLREVLPEAKCEKLLKNIALVQGIDVIDAQLLLGS